MICHQPTVVPFLTPSLFAVMLQPENVQIATLDEHFAVDSHAR